MATISKLQVELSLIDKMSAGLKTVGSNLDSIGQKATAAGQKMTAALTLPLVGAAIIGVKAASSLNEAMSAVQITFGTSAQEVIKWSESSARAFGLSQQQALTAANQFGALGKAVGLTTEEAVVFSQSLVQAAADLGAFYNVDPGQALEILRSGLAGEAEPLRQFNIYLNEAAVNAEAMRLGLVGANGEITEGAKVQARYSLIMQGIGPAQGNFAATSGEVAGQMRIANAEFTNAAAVLGTQLTPAVLALSGGVTSLSVGFQNLSPAMQTTVTVLGTIAAVVGPLALAIGFVISNLLAFQVALGLIVAPIGAITTVFITFVTFLFGPVILAIVAVKTNFLGLGDAFSAVTGTIKNAMTAIVSAVGSMKTSVVSTFSSLKTTTLSTVSDWLAGTKAYLAVFLTVFTTVWQSIYDAVAIQMISIKEKVGGVLNEIGGSVFSKGWSVGYNIGSGIISGIDAIWGAVVSKAQSLANAVADIVRNALNIGSPSKVMAYYGEMIGEGLIQGMESSVAGVSTAAGGLAGAALGGMTNYGGFTFNVSGAGDPDAVADAVFSRFAREVALHSGGA